MLTNQLMLVAEKNMPTLGLLTTIFSQRYKVSTGSLQSKHDQMTGHQQMLPSAA